MGLAKSSWRVAAVAFGPLGGTFPPYPTHCELGMTAMVHERQDRLSLRSGAVTGEGWEGDLRTSWMCVYVEVQVIASYLAHRLQDFTCGPIA